MKYLGIRLRIAAALALVVWAGACARAGEGSSRYSPRRGSSAGTRVVGNTVCVKANSVDREAIDRQGPVHLEEMFSRIPGVRVAYGRDGFSVQIRGPNTLLGSGEPLYVIDGMPVQGVRNTSIPVNPIDVECIQVLKDVGETSMFGTRGANGVVLITTRRGG
jgi:TonB-dependent SusC/RagA subfamily outer membrane receptor